ncbi:hypothetical protein DFH28DRAFT_956890, partial [Melampsora americana]
MSSPTFNDHTPLSQITSQLVAAESYACQSGRKFGFPNLDAEREEQILAHLRNTLKSRSKTIQASLLDKYRRICAESSSSCPPLPITGIKTCLAILKMIKLNTPHDAIERLADVFESWRCLLLDDAGPVIAGIDSIWKCKALRQLVGQSAPVKRRKSSVTQSTTTDRAPEQPAHVPLPSSPEVTPAIRSLPVSPPALQDFTADPDPLPSSATGPSKGSATAIQADSDIMQVRGTTSVVMIDSKSLPQQAPHKSPKVHTQPTNVGRTTSDQISATRPVVDNTQSTLPTSRRIQAVPQSAAQPSNDVPTLPPAQPSAPSCGDAVKSCGALSVEIENWLAAVRLIDDALTEHLNWCSMPAPFGISSVTPYIPDPSSSTYDLTFKYLTIPAPTLAGFPNYIPVFSSPRYPPPKHPPIITVVPLPPPTGARSLPTSTGPASLGRLTLKNLEGSQRIDTACNKDSAKSSEQQALTLTTCVASSPPALGTGRPQQTRPSGPSITPTIGAPAVASSSRTTELGTKQTLEPLTTVLPTTGTCSSLAPPSTTDTRTPPSQPNPAKPSMASQQKSAAPLLVDPAITSLPPPANRHTFNEEQKTRFASVYSRATFSERARMVSVLKDYGFGDTIHAIIEPFRQSADSVQPTPIQKNIPPAGAPASSPSAMSNVLRDPITVPVPSTSRDPSLQAPATDLNRHISPTLRHLKPLPVSRQSSNTSAQTSDQRPTAPVPFTLDPKITKMLQAMFNRGPQTLPVLFHTFAKLNETNKDSIVSHIKTLAYPLTGAVDGLWALRTPIATPSGPSGAPKITNPAERSSLGFAVTSVEPSFRPDNRTKPPSTLSTSELVSASQTVPTKPPSPLSSSSLASALQTGFPVNQPLNSGPRQSKPSLTSCLSQAVAAPTSVQNLSTNTPVLVIPGESNSDMARKRSFPSDYDDIDKSDTLTDTTQGSSALIAAELMVKPNSIRTDRSIRPRLDTQSVVESERESQNLTSDDNHGSRQISPPALKPTSLVINDRVNRLRSERRSNVAPDFQRESRNSRSRLNKTHTSRQTSPSALKSPSEQLEPFKDDLPGYPVVDPTIQQPGTRARILAKYREDEQMAPFRTFVPIVPTRRY